MGRMPYAKTENKYHNKKGKQTHVGQNISFCLHLQGIPPCLEEASENIQSNDCLPKIRPSRHKICLVYIQISAWIEC